jgi:RND family efflux transporter MFP subunit
MSLMIATALAPGCSRHATPAPKGGGGLSPAKVVLARNVELTTALQKPLVYRVETVGVLEAEGQTDIAAGVSGVVDDVFFREGDEVKLGTLLLTIDQARYQAEAEVARANAERAKANLDLSRDIADRTLRGGNAFSDEDRAKARGNLKIAEAEHLSALAALARSKLDLERSRVRAPYGGRINKRLVTKGSYLEEKTPIATIADLSRIRLVAYAPETAAPVLRELLQSQDDRLDAARLGLALAGAGPGGHPWVMVLNGMMLERDYVLSGYDPEFELLALPGVRLHGRIFYMSTVANPDTHMFEAKAEVLGWFPAAGRAPASAAGSGLDSSETPAGVAKTQPRPPAKPELSLEQNGHGPGEATKNGDVPHSLNVLKTAPTANPSGRRLRFSDPKLWPGFTAKIHFPLRSNPDACVVPEEAVRASERGMIAFVPVQQTREDGKLEWIARARTLDLGFRADGWVEVRQGLAAGEWLVRRGAEALEDGTPIRFQGGPK